MEAASAAAMVLLAVRQVESVLEVHVVVALLLLPVIVFVHILATVSCGGGSRVVGGVISEGIGLLKCVFKSAGGRRCMERCARQHGT